MRTTRRPAPPAAKSTARIAPHTSCAIWWRAPPPKGLDTVTAASDAAEKAEAQGAKEVREHRIRTRAYELWEQDGRPDRHPSDFWLLAEAEVARVED